VRRFVFKPKWVLGHLLVVAAALTCLRLGDWQWTRALSTESVQNWGYAFQWPLFSVCFLVGWWRMLMLESRRLDEEGEQPKAQPPPPVDAPLLAGPAPRPAPARRARGEDDEEDGLAAYNRMLALLAAEDKARDEARDQARDKA
jgi:hypothetical protein